MKREDIEKAARDYATDKINVKSIIERSRIKIAFKTGAAWRINSVWHDASEEPEPCEYMLVEHKKEDGNYSMVIYFGKPKDRSTWNRWAYIEDLLPNTEE